MSDKTPYHPDVIALAFSQGQGWRTAHGIVGAYEKLRQHLAEYPDLVRLEDVYRSGIEAEPNDPPPNWPIPGANNP